MYAYADVLFYTRDGQRVDGKKFECYKFGTKNCEEIKLNADAASMCVDVLLIDANVSASIKIKFYNCENELINYQDLSLCEFKSNHKRFIIPENSVSVIICFTTLYKQCDNCV